MRRSSLVQKRIREPSQPSLTQAARSGIPLQDPSQPCLTQNRNSSQSGNRGLLQKSSFGNIRSNAYSRVGRLPTPRSILEVAAVTTANTNYYGSLLPPQQPRQNPYRRPSPNKQICPPQRQIPAPCIVVSETSISSIRVTQTSGRESRIPTSGTLRYGGPSGIRPPSNICTPRTEERMPSQLKQPSRICPPTTSRLRPPSKLKQPSAMYSVAPSYPRTQTGMRPGEICESAHAARYPPCPENEYDAYDLQADILADGESEDDHYDENVYGKFGKKSPPKESLMQWFDRAVETEMHNRQGAGSTEHVLQKLEATLQAKPAGGNLSMHQAVSAASGVDIETKLRLTQDTELTDAVDKLIKAQAIEQFQDAVYAAELAAEMASPEFAEEAAAAAAKDMASIIQYESNITGKVSQKIPGEKPIEVVGYIGITRPKKPMRPRHWNA